MIYLYIALAFIVGGAVGFAVGFKTAIHITKTRILPEQGYYIKDGKVQPIYPDAAIVVTRSGGTRGIVSVSWEGGRIAQIAKEFVNNAIPGMVEFVSPLKPGSEIKIANQMTVRVIGESLDKESIYVSLQKGQL